MNQNQYALIMAGGVGSRFWPISRTTLPKQFIDVLGTGKSLLQETYQRFKHLIPEENIYILTNQKYKELVKEQLEIEDESRIIGEPAMRNTAPCIAYACHKLAALNPKATMVIAPSDHLIQDTVQFLNDVALALQMAEQSEALITLGIKPSRPDTGYGYIQLSDQKLAIPAKGADQFIKVQAFKEKPNLEIAKSYLASGNYLWNAGIFIWNVQNILQELEKYEPELDAVFKKGQDVYNTGQEAEFLESYYPQTKNISIDYAIMERSEQVYVLPVDFGWSDLGTWTSVYGLSEKKENGNVLIPEASNVLLYNSSNCMVHVPEYKKVVIKGLHDYIVVESNNTLMICPMDSEQEVKQVVADAAKQFGEEYI